MKFLFFYPSFVIFRLKQKIKTKKKDKCSEEHSRSVSLMPKTWRIGLAPVRGLSNENVLSPDQKLAKHWLSAWLPGLARSPGPGGPERPGSRLTAIRLPSLHCGNAWQTLANCLTRHSTFVNQSIICIFTIWYNLIFYEIRFKIGDFTNLQTSQYFMTRELDQCGLSAWCTRGRASSSEPRSTKLQRLTPATWQYLMVSILVPGPGIGPPTGHQPLGGRGDMRWE